MRVFKGRKADHMPYFPVVFAVERFLTVRNEVCGHSSNLGASSFGCPARDSFSLSFADLSLLISVLFNCKMEIIIFHFTSVI